MDAAKRWALILMGGGARGLAHVGVLRVLEKNGLTPAIVTGTSMGAIVGGCYAAGVTAETLTGWLGGLSADDFGRKGGAAGLFKRPKNLFEYVLVTNYKNRFFGKFGRDKGDAIEATLKSFVGEARIEDLPVRFACNAVDLVSGREVLFTAGPLYKALRATMSLPLVFAPVRMGGMLLLDGGIVNSAPVEAARAMGAEVAVLVDIHRPLKRLPAARIKGPLQVVQRTIEVASAASFEERARAADFVIRVPVDLGILEFSETRRIARKGERAAAAALPALREAVGAEP
ncbi:MAG TPA: patatin-like phospholipase family protein [Candidatus Aminicenantes bacterium]|nr:patatin-like phospholipase family protein [Candidatus Aminicenantes bacterium]